MNKALPAAANREGIGHLAFKVDDVEKTLNEMLENGGKKLGEVVSKEFKSGTLVFTYATDPEDNIIEIQSWISK